MGSRCATRSYLQMCRSERPWTGRPSTTQLIQGTMCAFLKLTKDYAIYPDSRAFMIHGTKGHKNLEVSDEYSLLEERFNDSETEITGIADVLEIENGRTILVDHKTSGSFKVAKALGFYVDEEPTGEVYRSGKRKGEEKTRKVLKRDDSKMDRYEWELQLNKYRMEYERRGYKPDELKIQCIVRDGNTWIARSRGVFRNVYYFNINILPDEVVNEYFERKKASLFIALECGVWNNICTKEENWDGLKCQNYCEVAEFCKYGKYLHKEREAEEMAIKGLSEIRRLPRLGKIRLGVKKKTAKGVEYPSEVDYFILDPQTPSELENQKIKDEFKQLYGDQPKSISIMFPVADPDVYFPQFYKRYGSATSLKCKGDGITAVCGTEEFAKGLERIRTDEMGLPVVKCLGKECIYYKAKECSEVGVLQILLPDLPGAGVWQISTGSFHSIVNLNSCIEYIRAVCGRAHMIPLTLERRMQETAHDGKKSKHFILHINMDFKLADLQKFALIEPTKMLLELPEPEAEKEDILLGENLSTEAEILPGESGPDLVKIQVFDSYMAEWIKVQKNAKAAGEKLEIYIKWMADQNGVSVDQVKECCKDHKAFWDDFTAWVKALATKKEQPKEEPPSEPMKGWDATDTRPADTMIKCPNDDGAEQSLGFCRENCPTSVDCEACKP